MNLTDLLPLLFWLDDRLWALSQYISKWVLMLDPGEDEDDDEHS